MQMPATTHNLHISCSPSIPAAPCLPPSLHLTKYLNLSPSIPPPRQGVDAIYCAASNDCFVTSAWAKSLNAGEKMTILADGDCAFAKLVGLTVETEGFGGQRLSRFSALVEDGVVTKLHLEEGGGYTGASGADQMLKDLE